MIFIHGIHPLPFKMGAGFQIFRRTSVGEVLEINFGGGIVSWGGDQGIWG